MTFVKVSRYPGIAWNTVPICKYCGTRLYIDELTHIYVDNTDGDCCWDENNENESHVPDEDNIGAIMVGDDRLFTFDKDDVATIDRESFCGECGQIDCSHDGLDRE